MTTLLSIVTICKGRLHHLKQTLPRMVAQSGVEIVVVDYDCPDGTAAWVRENFPAVKIVEVEEAPIFHHAHARNLGAQEASGRWLIFVDADLLIAPEYIDQVTPLLIEGRYFRPAILHKETWGHVICLKSDFNAVGGYDEVMYGWGGEDNDLFTRLDLLGCEPDSIPDDLVEPIHHGDDERVAFSDTSDSRATMRANGLYRQIKSDLMLQTEQRLLPLETRQAIYEEVRRTVLSDANRGLTSSRVVMDLPIDTRRAPIPGWSLRRQWIYQLEKRPDAPLRDQSLSKATGTSMQVEITTRCNFDCFYCAGRDMPQNDMSYDAFSAIVARHVGQHGIPQYVQLQGEGEPTLHPNFFQMALDIRRMGSNPQTITNGTYKHPERFVGLFSHVGVSLDTLNETEGRRIGRHNVDRAKNFIESLAAHLVVEVRSVSYGQPLEAVAEWCRQRNLRHTIQRLQGKADYSKRYPEHPVVPAPLTVFSCRYLSKLAFRYYTIQGQELPCCYIKDTSQFVDLPTMVEHQKQRTWPSCCTGCHFGSSDENTQ